MLFASLEQIIRKKQKWANMKPVIWFKNLTFPKFVRSEHVFKHFLVVQNSLFEKKSVVWALSSLKHCTSVCLNKTREELKNANCENSVKICRCSPIAIKPAKREKNTTQLFFERMKRFGRTNNWKRRDLIKSENSSFRICFVRYFSSVLSILEV